MIVFSSGSCRIGFPLTYLHAQGKINLIDTHWDGDHPDNDIGYPGRAYALAHYHSILEHHSLFKLLEDDSNESELFNALHQINRPKAGRYVEDWKHVWDRTKSMWTDCKVVVIEISSTKSVRPDLPRSSIEETIKLMPVIEDMIPDKKVLWVSHFRPMVIWDKPNSKWTKTRERIYDAVSTGTHFFDPSTYLKDHTLLRDQDHYSPKGIKEIAWKFLEKIESICDNIK